MGDARGVSRGDANSHRWRSSSSPASWEAEEDRGRSSPRPLGEREVGDSGLGWAVVVGGGGVQSPTTPAVLRRSSKAQIWRLRVVAGAGEIKSGQIFATISGVAMEEVEVEEDGKEEDSKIPQTNLNNSNLQGDFKGMELRGKRVMNPKVLSKGTKVEVNVSEWTSESAAIGKMHVVWVIVEGLPDEMKVELLAEEDKNKALQIIQDRELALVLQEKEARGQFSGDKAAEDNIPEHLMLEFEKASKSAPHDVSVARETQEGQFASNCEDGVEVEGDEEGKLQLGDSEELFDSQDSEDAFAKKLGIGAT
ncbi:hypothetical protein OsJ_33946 [Oryza sativa Japonica Group]|uniref:Uncharacterized protein n=1 Tax=Oryza sativa subsp. japonica TaxID=39947 RepID=B9GAS0_ORYSJ|nr:hypothetical protein OsJ_33946 [Oryza sativa Japonica Group]